MNVILVIEKLSLEEDMKFTKLEKKVDQFKSQFVECGLALKEIRDQRYYRKYCKTFDEYLEKRAGFSRQHASQLIIGAVAVKALPKDLSTQVDNPKAASALAKVPVASREAVVKASAQAAGGVSTKTITEAAKVIDERATKFEPPEDVLDEVGYKIPVEIQPLWNRRNEVAELMTQISEVKSAVKKGLEENDPLYRELTEHFLVQISNVYNVMREAKPYAVCPSCNGRNIDKCRLCKGRGFLSSFKYKGPSVTDEMRAFREKMAKK